MVNPRPSPRASRCSRTAALVLVGVVAASIAAPFVGTTSSAHADPALSMISTAVGTIGDGGSASSAYVQGGWLATDSAGNVYVPDESRIRRIDAASHIVTTVAGNGLTTSAGDGGLATDASFRANAVAVAPNGDVYVSDYINSNVRKIIKATGIIVAVAGTGVSGSTGDGGQATEAQLSTPGGIALDSAGALYIAEVGTSTIRRVGTNGIISTVAGTGTPGFNGNNQPALSLIHI